jgi:Outer membrane lipoprotein-sorting protein
MKAIQNKTLSLFPFIIQKKRASRLIFSSVILFFYSGVVFSVPFELSAQAIDAVGMSEQDIAAEARAPMNPEAEGLAIVTEMQSRLSGFHDLQADIKAQIIDSNGRVKLRELTMQTLEGTESGDKSLNTFISPPDQKGVALLTHAHKTAQNEQWLYLPSIKRVKKIAYQTQSSPFMGSEFTYEDLAPIELEKYRYRFVGEERVGGQVLRLVEQVPVKTESGYSKQIQWIDEEYRFQRVDYFNKEGVFEKTMTLSGYQLVNGRFWHAELMTMVNHLTKNRTILQRLNYKINAGLTEFDFTTLKLKRQQ